MAHFAKINSDKIVLSVVAFNNSDMLDSNGIESETVGQQYLEQHNNHPAELWIQTSYNTAANTHLNEGVAFRGNYAQIGSIWDSKNNIFWHPKPFNSWVQNITTALWESPIGNAPDLTDEQVADTNNRYAYKWNEDNQSWDIDIISN
jgi:hypothetical protein|tara:strand:- start:509 stop:949 length:441 start_codon:yes stop_codon:yes gene_type:complete